MPDQFPTPIDEALQLYRFGIPSKIRKELEKLQRENPKAFDRLLKTLRRCQTIAK